MEQLPAAACIAAVSVHDRDVLTAWRAARDIHQWPSLGVVPMPRATGTTLACLPCCRP